VLTFDVETVLRIISTYVIVVLLRRMRYSWISPRLLGGSSEPQYIIFLVDSLVQRVVVSNNLSWVQFTGESVRLPQSITPCRGEGNVQWNC
jgi:hypothetical protein